MRNKLFVALCLLLLCTGCDKPDSAKYSINQNEINSVLKDAGIVVREKLEQNVTERHAFIMADGLVFIADVPVDWRYTLSPVYEYTYYGYLAGGGSYIQETNCRIRFIGIGENDSEDNFFTITARKGEEVFEYDFPITTNPFIFQDGTKGEWAYQTGELALRFEDARKIYYEGIVQDLEKKYSIYLWMLKDEYDAKEREITDFLESACFRIYDLGVSEKTDFLERELLTLHLWSRYMKLSAQLPEGVVFARREFTNVDSYRACSYSIYLDEDKEVGITFESDQGGGIKDPTGDYKYHLNTKDFEETVYELSGNDYYFPNYNLMVRTWNRKGDAEVWDYLKKIVQSIRFE